jgi:nicotinamide-nucleotide amidase
MRAEIISIGDEMTSGQRLDTNSQWLAQRLGEIGVPVAFHTTVGDTLADNVLVFRQACERAELVIATGGLGPTADDLTRQALADLAGVPLVQDEASLAHIRALFARRKREMPPANLVQAQFPQGAQPIPNPHGTAPGIDLASPRAVGKPVRVFALPGVPAEMKEMWQATVAPAVQALLGVERVIVHYRIKCFGVGESDLEAMMPDLIARQRYPLVGITVHQATITLRISAAGETADAARVAMQSTIDTIHDCLGDLIFGYEEEELPDVVVRLLAERRQTLAVTEWGTCGLVTQWLAALGASEQFVGGAVRTSREEWTAAESTAVPHADYHLLVGPAPAIDSARTGAGTLPLVLLYPGGRFAKEIPYSGHPEILRPRAAKQALNLLRLHLLGKLPA